MTKDLLVSPGDLPYHRNRPEKLRMQTEQISRAVARGVPRSMVAACVAAWSAEHW